MFSFLYFCHSLALIARTIQCLKWIAAVHKIRTKKIMQQKIASASLFCIFIPMRHLCCNWNRKRRGEGKKWVKNKQTDSLNFSFCLANEFRVSNFESFALAIETPICVYLVSNWQLFYPVHLLTRHVRNWWKTNALLSVAALTIRTTSMMTCCRCIHLTFYYCCGTMVWQWQCQQRQQHFRRCFHCPAVDAVEVVWISPSTLWCQWDLGKRLLAMLLSLMYWNMLDQA